MLNSNVRRLAAPFLRRAGACAVAACLLAPCAGAFAGEASPSAGVFAGDASNVFYLPVLTVTGTREAESTAETPASVSVIPGQTVREVAPAHPAEILGRVPGVVVEPTTGEGHLTGIRQPFGTSPVYLFLEDGVPIRSTGFFNHNALYEIDIPQAGGIEVIRGPGSALYGSDAIGGTVNVLTRAPSLTPEAEARFETGSFGWMRGLATASTTEGDTGVRADLNVTRSGGWRDETAYGRQSATLRGDHWLSGTALLKTVIAFSHIDQETGANSVLYNDDYKNNPAANYTPIAFRKVQAFRISTAYENDLGDTLWSFTPYMRWNQMTLLPSWQLSYDPVVYTTGATSFGMLAKYRRDFAPWRSRLIVGTDLDYSPGFHDENKVVAAKVGNYFRSYTVGAKIYDYDATFMQASPYLQAETSPLQDLRFSGGMRLDLMSFEYDNKLGELPTGNWRRPESDTRTFHSLTPNIGATYAISPDLNVFARYAEAFRVPSESQLFRQGGNVDSIHLRPIHARNAETGLRGAVGKEFSFELSAYRMIKADDILTSKDFAGNTSTNSGKTRHQGFELAADYRFLPDWRLQTAFSVSEHKYLDWVSSNGDFSGKIMSFAPAVTNTLTLGYTPSWLAGGSVELEWVHMGDYYMDDANTHIYGGHDLVNLRGNYAITDYLGAFARIMNAGDARRATTAQFSSAKEQYVPGLPLAAYAGIEVRL